MMNCLNHLFPIQFRKANSVSRTDTWVLSDHYDKTYFCKTFSSISKGLQYEADVYSYIKRYFIDNGEDTYKNNFVQLYCHVQKLKFNDLLDFLNSGNVQISHEQLMRNILFSHCGKPYNRPALDSDITTDWAKENVIPKCFRELDAIRRKIESVAEFEVIITELKKDTWSMVQFMHLKNISNTEKYAVVAKLVLCMYKMHQINICHNDIHWQNVLVYYSKDEYKRGYIYNEQTYYFDTNWCPLLFDWDKAQINNTNVNNVLLHVDLYDPPFNPQRDWITLFVAAYKLKTIPYNTLYPLFFSENQHGTLSRDLRMLIRNNSHWANILKKEQMDAISHTLRINIPGIVELFGGKNQAA